MHCTRAKGQTSLYICQGARNRKVMEYGFILMWPLTFLGSGSSIVSGFWSQHNPTLKLKQVQPFLRPQPSTVRSLSCSEPRPTCSQALHQCVIKIQATPSLYWLLHWSSSFLKPVTELLTMHRMIQAIRKQTLCMQHHLICWLLSLQESN